MNTFQGLFQGLLIPSIFGHLAKWSLQHERNIMGTFIFSGYYVGIILSVGLSRNLPRSEVFFISGAIGIAWTLLWFIFAADSPLDSHHITIQEKFKFHLDHQDESHQKSIPWKCILKSPPFLSLVFVTCALKFGVNRSEIAMYFNKLLKLDIGDNALYQTLPQVSTVLLGFVFLAIAQFLQTSRNVSLTKLRKSYSVIACGVPVFVYISLAFLDKFPITAVVLIIFKSGMTVCHDIAFWLNVMDLSPKNSAVLFGILSSIGTFFEIVSSFVIDAIIDGKWVSIWKKNNYD